MLRVECESCKSPYQVDERRVPAHGLKMRCPKCGTTFVVNNPAFAAPKSVPLSSEKPKPHPQQGIGAAPQPSLKPPMFAGLGGEESDLPAARPAPAAVQRKAPTLAPKIPPKAASVTPPIA